MTCLYRGTSLIRNSATLEPYSRDYAQGLMVVLGGALSLMSEASLEALARRRIGGGAHVSVHGLLEEIGNLLPNNRRQRRTCYALCHILYPVSAAHTSIFRMDSNSTSYGYSNTWSTSPCELTVGLCI